MAGSLSFGERQLQKLGWMPGQDGITKPILAVFKNDTIGLGKGANDYKGEWWDDLYTTTASTLTTTDSTLTTTPQPVNPEIMPTSSLYKSFTNKPVVMQPLTAQKERISDKELFELCGGRSGNQRGRLNAAADSDDETTLIKKPHSDTAPKEGKARRDGESQEDRRIRRADKKLRRSAREFKRADKARRKLQKVAESLTN